MTKIYGCDDLYICYVHWKSLRRKFEGLDCVLFVSFCSKTSKS